MARPRLAMCLLGGAGSLCAWLGAGCTPLGLWVYEDPKIEVAAARFLDEPEPTAEVELAVSNSNDYAVTVVAYDVAVAVDERRSVSTVRDQSIPMAKRDRTPLRFRVDPAGSSATRPPTVPGRPVTIEGEVRMTTPIGERRVRFRASGRTDGRDAQGGTPVSLDGAPPAAPQPVRDSATDQPF